MSLYVKVWKVSFPDQFNENDTSTKYRTVVLDAVGIVSEDLGIYETEEDANQAKTNWLEFNESI
jgi:hypothetical protein